MYPRHPRITRRELLPEWKRKALPHLNVNIRSTTDAMTEVDRRHLRNRLQRRRLFYIYQSLAGKPGETMKGRRHCVKVFHTKQIRAETRTTTCWMKRGRDLRA